MELFVLKLLLNFPLVCLAFSLISAAPYNSADTSKEGSTSFRLPKHIEPEQYYIELEPDFKNAVFNGSVRIEFSVKEESNNITLHAKQLEIDTSSITLTSARHVFEVINTNQINDEREFYIIFFNDTLTAGADYNLTISKFRGILNSDNVGFYLAKYKDEDGIERYGYHC